MSIQIGGLTNTSTTGSYTSVISTYLSGVGVDTGTTAAVVIGGSLVNATWLTSSTTAGATGVTYSYYFAIATSSTLTSVTMTVPSGTAGTAVVGTVSPSGLTSGQLARLRPLLPDRVWEALTYRRDVSGAPPVRADD